MLIDSIIAVGISIVSSYVKVIKKTLSLSLLLINLLQTEYGIQTPYFIAMILAVINMLLIMYLVPDLDNKGLEKDPEKRKQLDETTQ